MKKLIMILLLGAGVARAENCRESVSTKEEPVVYNVNAEMPAHLRGASIIVVRADGTATKVPAEKFMVVPRKQYTVAGSNKLITQRVSCSAKNTLMQEARRDVTEINAEAEGDTASVYSRRELVPGLNYYRHDLLGPIGAGVGIDANGTAKGLVGVDF